MGDDCFYQYEVFDPGDGSGTFFGKKVLALSYGGSIYLRGAKGIRPEGTPIDAVPSDSGTSWVRLTDTLEGGEDKFHVDRPVPTWGHGDHIVLTTTDYLPGHSEALVIDSVSSDEDGTLIKLLHPLKYPHNGTAYNFSSLPPGNGPKDDPNRPLPPPAPIRFAADPESDPYFAPARVRFYNVKESISGAVPLRHPARAKQLRTVACVTSV